MMRLHILVVLIFTGCTITISPIKQNTVHVHHHHAAKPSEPARAVRKTPVKNGHIVNADWIKEYRSLENQKGNYTINDDALIEPMPDGRFKVPQHVIDHYQDLTLATPTP